MLPSHPSKALTIAFSLFLIKINADTKRFMHLLFIHCMYQGNHPPVVFNFKLQTSPILDQPFLTVKSFVQCLLSSDKVSNVHKRNYSQCLFIEGQYHKQTFKLINLTYEGQLYGKFKTLVSLLINETIKCCSLQENEVLNLPTVTASYFNSQLSISDHPYIFLF